MTWEEHLGFRKSTLHPEERGKGGAEPGGDREGAGGDLN